MLYLAVLDAAAQAIKTADIEIDREFDPPTDMNDILRSLSHYIELDREMRAVRAEPKIPGWWASNERPTGVVDPSGGRQRLSSLGDAGRDPSDLAGILPPDALVLDVRLKPFSRDMR